MQKHISSLQNPLIKQILQLGEKSRERKKQGLFVVEGQREISLAMKGSYEIETLLFCSEIITSEALTLLQKEISANYETIEISKEVYEKLAYRTTTEGVIAICKTKKLTLSQLNISNKNPLILVAEAPEKPGNIGALLRTADAANVDAVIIANPKTDMYNPNIIRSSVGCVFTNQIAIGNTSEIIQFLKDKKIAMYCAALQASIPYHTCDFKTSSAIVVGTEADGLSEDWLQNSTQNIIIPMQGEIDSMNVSVAAGILIFEAKRQRNFK
ncbi:RNA methyltransferase [Aureisphaera sp. CAU 1614]|uniref:RNA methyltransferase n=1 Tax=Halomarinibacterium sedimenti TaxID=2857106 RepID=A0A9X1FPE3_9FLAO|nr:RNA methyltransferase [Halomarinibacterium sedimenti]MBW2938335.1 RNA methyltransferase [Halomarinibacterium sedimenti]